MLNRINKKIEEEDMDEDGLPQIDPKQVEEYIIYYEKLISKKVYSNISKVRDQARKKIQKRHKSQLNKVRFLKLGERIAQVKAFYEGDIVQMDKAQKNYKEPTTTIKWYEWDMVMVIPNPDFKQEKN